MPEYPATLPLPTPAQRIAAGALIALGPGGGPTGDLSVPTDLVRAQRFVHPAVPGRVVVRLVPSALAAGAEAEMALMGFGAQGVGEELALRRRQAVGFPAHALLIDPERAHIALDLMGRFRAEARRAAASPGHARDGFQALADALEAAAPHFLPSFWEQAGRAFIDGGALAFAASCFDRARAAERAHGLAVDPQRQADVWLEFALGGALTAKALRGRGRALAAGGRAGFSSFLDLCSRCVMGGIAPWSTMPSDVRRAGKAAGLPLPEVEEALVSALIDAPVLAKASCAFWTDLAPSVIGVAQRAPHVRKRLLGIVPTNIWGSGDLPSLWVRILEDSGALGWAERRQGLPASLAAWVQRFMDPWHRTRGLRLLLRRLAPALRAAGEPLRALHHRTGKAEAALVDEALELGLPLEDPPADSGWIVLDLSAWISAPRSGSAWDLDAAAPAQERTLGVLAAHPAWGRQLLISLLSRKDGAAFLQAAQGIPGLDGLRHRVGLHLTEGLGGLGVFAAATMLTQAQRAGVGALQGEFTDLPARIEAVDPAAALARTLRLGLFAELCWPAWERVTAGARGGGPVRTAGSPSAPIVTVGARAHVLGGEEVLLTHDLQLLDGAAAIPVAFADGQLLCASGRSGSDRGYWSGAPGRVFTVQGSIPYRTPGGHPGPSGGVVLGVREVRAGDTALGPAATTISDGRSYWTWHQGGWAALDPATGQIVPGAPPPLVGGAGTKDVVLHAVPPDAPGEVTGCAHGVYGFRSEGLGGARQYWRADGLSWVDQRPLWTYSGIVRLVEGAPLLGIRFGHEGGAPLIDLQTGEVLGLHLADPFDAGWQVAPPFHLWHFLRPRDPAGSRALRSLTLAQASALLAAAHAAPRARGPDPALIGAVATVVPEVTAPALRAAVAAWAAAAAELEVARAALLAERPRPRPVAAAGGAGGDPAPEMCSGPDSLMHRLFEVVRQGTARWSHWDPPRGFDLGHAIRDAGHFLAGADLRLTSSLVPWLEVGEDWLAAVFIASVGADALRLGLAGVLDAWASSGLLASRPGLRHVRLRLPGATHPMARCADPNGAFSYHVRLSWGYVEGPHRYVCSNRSRPSHGAWELDALERAGPGGFAVPEGATLLDELPLRLPAQPDALRAAAAALRARGPRLVREDDVRRLAQAVDIPPAAARLLLWGGPQGDPDRADPLGPAVRAQLGLGLAEAALGLRVLQEALFDPTTHKSTTLTPILRDAVPMSDPARLWSDPDGVVDALAAGWRAAAGHRRRVPDGLLGAALACAEALPGFLQRLYNPRSVPRWPAPVPPALTAGGVDLPAGSFTSDELDVILLGALWLLYATPTGDPARGLLGPLMAEALACARSPDMAICLPDQYLDAVRDRARAVYPQLDLPEELRVERQGAGERRFRFKAAPQALLGFGGLDAVTICLWPARAPGPADPLLGAVAAVAPDRARPRLARWFALRSPGVAAALADATASTLPDGVWAQDPRRSAPDLVAAVADTLALGQDSAALYLQVLALPDPTKRNVLQWNAWTAAAYAKAEAPLLAAGLLCPGSRPRAGRGHFLPGAWEARRAPDLPIERWKLPLFQWDLNGIMVDILSPLLPLEPLPALFRRAWARVRSGDAPRLDEV